MKAQSVRLPNKNIKIFHGNPLYQVVLDTLIKSSYVKEIIIDTDIESILGLTDINQKVKIVQRPEKLRGDYVPFMDIIEYDMNQTNATLLLVVFLQYTLALLDKVSLIVLLVFDIHVHVEDYNHPHNYVQSMLQMPQQQIVS